MLAIFESHPIQYRTPIYRALQKLIPGQFHVFFATDISVRGHMDKDFGKEIAWDIPLLEGYPSTVLGLENGTPLAGFNSLQGMGMSEVFAKWKPQAVLQTQFLYRYDFAVLHQAIKHRVPVWIRQETQDDVFCRPAWKTWIRSTAYSLLYSQIEHAFYIGSKNREHLLRHGIQLSRLSRSPYSTPDRFEDTQEEQMQSVGTETRRYLGIHPDSIVIGFFGKLIEKKNPRLILAALRLLPESDLPRITLLFVGSGVLEPILRCEAEKLESRGVKVIFTGFVNQSALPEYYAATHIMVLPSRRQGETWGLVVNEALQAGCSVAMSDAVGCSVEFGDLPHCRVFKDDDPIDLAKSLTKLMAALPEKRDWARDRLESYSIACSARALAAKVEASFSSSYETVAR